MTASQLTDVLSELPVEELHLGNISLEMDTILEAINPSSVSMLTTSWMYKRPLEFTADNPSVDDNIARYSDLVAGAPRVFQSTRKFPIAQLVFVRQVFGEGCPRLGDGGIRWAERASQCTMDLEPTDFLTPQIMAIPLADSLLSCKELVGCLPSVLERLTGARSASSMMSMSMGALGQGLAQQLAAGKDNRILPLPTETYAIYKKVFHGGWAPPPPVLPLQPGFWTVCVFHEQPERYLVEHENGVKGGSLLRYAFVSITADNDLIVLDANAFLEAVMSSREPEQRQRLLDTWDEEMHTLEDTMASRTESFNNGERARVSPATFEEVVESLHLMKKSNRQLVKFKRSLIVQPDILEPEDEFPLIVKAILRRIEEQR